MSKNKLIIVIIIVLALLLVILTVLRRAPQPEEVTPIAEPEVISGVPTSLASGKQAYDIMTDSSEKFKIIEVEFDPLDVKQGEDQRVKVLVKDLEDKPITAEDKVEGTAYTDRKATLISFELRQVSDDNGSTLTEWEGFWTLEDTYDNIYMISITAKSADREHKVELTFR